MKNAIAMKTELLTNDLNIYLQIDAIMELKSHLSVYLSRWFANRDVMQNIFSTSDFNSGSEFLTF